MAKKVLQDYDVYDLKSKVFIPLPKMDIASLELEDEYAGPTREEVEAENQTLKNEAKAKAMEILDNAKIEAREIIKSAEDSSFDHVKKATLQIKEEDQKIRDDVEEYKQKQEMALQTKLDEQKSALQKEYEETKEKAREEGYNAGFESGQSEVQRLTERMHTIIEGAIDKRDHIIEDAEIQIIRIVLLIARKVVKAISESQKGVIIDNIKEALNKIKGKTEVIIRVNTEDLELTTEHKDDLMTRFEELQHVTILEDTRVDKGGCIIETDFGSVDARIATQLQEVEEKVRELANLSFFDGTTTVKGKKEEKNKDDLIVPEQMEAQAVVTE